MASACSEYSNSDGPNATNEDFAAQRVKIQRLVDMNQELCAAMRMMLREGEDPEAVYDIEDVGYLMQLARPSKPTRVRGPEGHRPGTLDPASPPTRRAVREDAEAVGLRSLLGNGLLNKFWDAVVLDRTPEEVAEASTPTHEDPGSTQIMTTPKAADNEHEQ
ncbi:hypothetical protein LTR78_000243 [Recurvomyces mirabilis]|uniref:Uncharacterized protein n=1 Tax=Recurvomyces mirabilis TaxID=574656 RepID=A0AAE0WXC8_9PEZI|nr:hypothetical protein LTR78_000243 [Recurvomyces mirabilis]KAK5161899.1 hypothetical protein LTS14_000244 [Recurvomyces mirabilis]